MQLFAISEKTFDTPKFVLIYVCVCVCVCVCLYVSGASLFQLFVYVGVLLNFRHRASFILGQAFHYSPENAFYIFNQQIYFII